MIDLLPVNMRKKIEYAHCAIPGLDPKCWNWVGAVTSRGYGSVSHEQRIWSTHRLAYELLVETIPTGLQIDHLCLNKTCCNPAHLEPVTGKVNCERTSAALKDRCIHGHPLVAPNLIVKTRNNGLHMRNCRVCAMDCQRRLRNAKRPFPSADKRRAEILAAAESALGGAAS